MYGIIYIEFVIIELTESVNIVRCFQKANMEPACSWISLFQGKVQPLSSLCYMEPACKRITIFPG